MISREEIEQLYDSYSKELYLYILRYVQSKEAAEDVLQDTFVRLITYSSKRDLSPDNIRALLYTIARTICIDAARSRKRRKETALDDTAIARLPAPESETSSLDEFLDIFIDDLGEPEKTILLMRKNGITYELIAQSTGISVRTIKRKTASVLSVLKDKLRKNGFLCESGINSGSGTLQ